MMMKETSKEKKPFSIIDDVYNQEGTKEIEEIFGNGNIFPFPKPTALIRHLVNLANLESDDIVLDFFAGSCTTAQAIFQFNNEFSKNLQFLVVQLPEPVPVDSQAKKAGFSSISEIGKERIRKVIYRIRIDRSRELGLNPINDLGFLALRLEKSNFKFWQSVSENITTQLGSLFEQFESPLVYGWQSRGLLTEILLAQGFPLDSNKRILQNFKDNSVQEISHDFCAHRLYICLDEKLNQATVAGISIRPEDIFVCLDSALTDEDKIRLSDRCNLKVI